MLVKVFERMFLDFLEVVCICVWINLIGFIVVVVRVWVMDFVVRGVDLFDNLEKGFVWLYCI